jgi:hypothetical protein
MAKGYKSMRISSLLIVSIFGSLLADVAAHAGMLGAAARALKQSDEAINTATKSLLITKGGAPIASPKDMDPQTPLGISREGFYSVPNTLQLREPALVMHWMPTRFTACAMRGVAAKMSKDTAMASCAERYKSCLEEKSVQNGLLKPSEICISYTNSESQK